MAQTHSFRLFRYLADSRARAQKRINALSFFPRFPCELLLEVALVLQRAFQHHCDSSHFHRFGQELFGAFLNRLHGQRNTAVSSKQNQRHRWMRLFELRQEIQCRPIGQ